MSLRDNKGLLDCLFGIIIASDVLEANGWPDHYNTFSQSAFKLIVIFCTDLIKEIKANQALILLVSF